MSNSAAQTAQDFKEKTTGELDEPLMEILQRVSVELQDVAVLIERLEPMLECEKIASVVDASQHLNLLQGIDLAVQKSRGLSDFLANLSNDMDTSYLIDATTALNLVTLSDLKKRLASGNVSVDSAEQYQNASGDLDFF